MALDRLMHLCHDQAPIYYHKKPRTKSIRISRITHFSNAAEPPITDLTHRSPLLRPTIQTMDRKIEHAAAVVQMVEDACDTYGGCEILTAARPWLRERTIQSGCYNDQIMIISAPASPKMIRSAGVGGFIWHKMMVALSLKGQRSGDSAASPNPIIKHTCCQPL